MPRRRTMVEKVDVIRRLQLNQSIRAIQRETGIHRTNIREIKDLALSKGWLEKKAPLPSEYELYEALNHLHNKTSHLPHPLDVWKEPIKRWVDAKYSFVVIHQLVSQQYQCSETTVRRYIHRQFPREPKAVMVRPTVAGEAMEVDFGYLGITYDPVEKRNRKTHLFSGRLRHSRIAYRERVFDQKQHTFFDAHIHAFEYFGGVPQKVVPDYVPRNIIWRLYLCDSPIVYKHVDETFHKGLLVLGIHKLNKW